MDVGTHAWREMTPARRGATARRFFELLAAMEIDGWGELWHPHARIIVPYPPHGAPSVIDGQQEIVDAIRRLFSRFDSFSLTLTGVYPAADSDTVCVEYRNSALISGIEYMSDHIAVLRFAGELISVYHDYFDPRRVETMVEALKRPGTDQIPAPEDDEQISQEGA